jgi:CheY-like chemotaxis protein
VSTPLILAIEQNRQQAEQLSLLFDRQFSAELVLAGSTSRAIAKLAGRVPELVLMSALTPPRDEATLLNWLRELGDAAAHVQTVTIPMLATEEPVSRRRPGALSFARDRPAAAPDSCDPSVFADWISVYLDLATHHRTEAGLRG